MKTQLRASRIAMPRATRFAYGMLIGAFVAIGLLIRLAGPAPEAVTMARIAAPQSVSLPTRVRAADAARVTDTSGRYRLFSLH